jgi:ATP-binding cassette subfamily E protein 1
MDITFRRDPVNFRPRINKLNSQKDQEQKASGNYFLADVETEDEKKAKAGLKEGKEGKESKESDETKPEKKAPKEGKTKKSKE